jgi:hypothetical protein
MAGRKLSLLGFSLAIVVLARVSGLAAEQDPVAPDNMLVVGEEAIYLHHLPMFQQEVGRPCLTAIK